MHKIVLLGAALAAAPALASPDDDLLAAAKGLAAQYDSNYAAKDAEAMSRLYTEDGILVSPSGTIIRGRGALVEYYKNRFASGAHDHHLTVTDAHMEAGAGFAISHFSVMSPNQVEGNLVAIYRHTPDGWHLRLVEPSIPEK
jgi:ketosteroid isomerase-like protein